MKEQSPSLIYQSISEGNFLLALSALKKGYSLDITETHNDIDLMSNIIYTGQGYQETFKKQLFKICFDIWEKDTENTNTDFILAISKTTSNIKREFLDLIISHRTYEFLKNESFQTKIGQITSEQKEITTNLLSYLVINENIEILKKIEQQIDDFNYIDNNGKPNLFYSLKNLKIFEYLLNKMDKEDILKTSLHGENLLDQIENNIQSYSHKAFLFEIMNEYEKRNNIKLFQEINLKEEIFLNKILSIPEQQLHKQSDIDSFIDKTKKELNIENINITNHQGKNITSILLEKKQIKSLYSLSRHNINGLKPDIKNNNKSLASDIGIIFSEITTNPNIKKIEKNNLRKILFKLLEPKFPDNITLKEIEENSKKNTFEYKNNKEIIVNLLINEYIKSQIDLLKINSIDKNFMKSLHKLFEVYNKIKEKSIYKKITKENMDNLSTFFCYLKDNFDKFNSDEQKENIYRICYKDAYLLKENIDCYIYEHTNDSNIVSNLLKNFLPLYVKSSLNIQNSPINIESFEEQVCKFLIKNTDSNTPASIINEDNKHFFKDTSQLKNMELKSILENQLINLSLNNTPKNNKRARIL